MQGTKFMNVSLVNIATTLTNIMDTVNGHSSKVQNSWRKVKVLLLGNHFISVSNYIGKSELSLKTDLLSPFNYVSPA